MSTITSHRKNESTREHKIFTRGTSCVSLFLYIPFSPKITSDFYYHFNTNLDLMQISWLYIFACEACLWSAALWSTLTFPVCEQEGIKERNVMKTPRLVDSSSSSGSLSGTSSMCSKASHNISRRIQKLHKTGRWKELSEQKTVHIFIFLIFSKLFSIHKFWIILQILKISFSWGESKVYIYIWRGRNRLHYLNPSNVCIPSLPSSLDSTW